ncbi:MAG: DUF998 domain-containing protein [Chloroflexi bacterium]|nr:DUF998 domain-containing protein [Chloroflexota bacterium]
MTIVAGILASTVITIGAILTAFPYVGDLGQSYSPFNHFISELGHTQESELAGLFNVALVVGGLLFALFMVGVGLRFTGMMRYVTAVGGVLTGLSGALVGVFPMDIDLMAHALVALGFFAGSLLVLILFSLYITFSSQTAYPRWLSLVALPMIASDAIFLVIVLSGGPAALDSPEGGRAAFWLTSTSEWGVLIFLMVWVTVIAIWRTARTES